MNQNIRCSVVMATYNGELYIAEQIQSILRNIRDDDELIISDDGSTDKTRQIILSYMETDNRIQLIDGPRNGVIRNFENALTHASGEYVFLCDQDDVWTDNKIKTVLSAMSDGVTCVLHDAEVIEDGNVLYPSFMAHRGSQPGILNNIVKNSYIGCCMAIKKEMFQYILPFPKGICMHDQWIGLLSEKYGESKFLQEPLLQYRRHSDNASSMSGLNVVQKLINRTKMLIALFGRIQKIKNMKKEN